MAISETSEDNGKATSGRSVSNLYIDKAGKSYSRPPVDVVKIVKVFKESGHKEEITLGDLTNEMLLQAAAFGLHQVGQNAYGAAEDEDEKIEKLGKRWENILAGQWASDRESGPRTSDLLNAFIRGYTAKNGGAPSDEWIETKRAQIQDPAVAKELQKRPAIKAQLDAIKAERAAERAKASAASADKADEVDDFE